MGRIRWIAGVAAAASLGALINASARADEAPANMAAGIFNVIEEIVVTARRREEPADEVPIAMSVFSGADLEAADIREVGELALFTPGLSFEKGFGRQLDRPVMRGMSTILSGTQVEQNLGFYIDGVFVSGAISATQLTNVERVEVLRGPQNALFGRAAFAGAVNFITQRPGDRLGGRVSATAAEHDEYRLTGEIGGPLVGDRLAFYANVSYYSYGGEYRNTVTDKILGGEETTSLSGSLYWTPRENFEARLRIAYAHDDDEHHPVRLQDSSFNNCFLDTPDQYYCAQVVTFDEVALNTDAVNGGGLERDTLRTNLTLTWDFRDHTVESITAYNDETLDAGLDQDFTARQPIEFFPFCPGFECLKGTFQTVDVSTFEDFSQELRIASPAGRRFRWLAGAYYFYREQGGERFQPAPQLKPVNRTNNYALFGQAQYDLSQRLAATVDFRAGWEKKSLALPDGEILRETFSRFTPRFALEYRAAQETLLYASVAKGSKPGGFNTNLDLPGRLRAFEEEEAWNYELGAKTQLVPGRLSAEIAGFFIDWTKQQLTSSFEPEMGAPIIFTENAGETEVLGLEIAFTARPAERLTIDGTYAFTDAEFKRFEVAEQEVLTGDPSVAGNKTPRAPRHMATLAATVEGRLTPRFGWFARGDVLYESKRFAQVHNFAHTGDKTILNARLGLRDENIRLTLWAKNLLDDRTPESIIRFRDFAGFDSFRAPRAFGIVLRRGRQFGATLGYEF